LLWAREAQEATTSTLAGQTEETRRSTVRLLQAVEVAVALVAVRLTVLPEEAAAVVEGSLAVLAVRELPVRETAEVTGPRQPLLLRALAAVEDATVRDRTAPRLPEVMAALALRTLSAARLLLTLAAAAAGEKTLGPFRLVGLVEAVTEALSTSPGPQELTV
jgi:hypothetical protein